MQADTKPRITLIARADNTGLGVQTWEFYRHMGVDRVFIIDLTEINLHHGKKTNLYPQRYMGADRYIVNGFPTPEDMNQMCKDTDLIFTVEIPYGYELFRLARERGIKTVLQYNFEFLDYLQDSTLPHPDLFMAPSPWRLNDAMHVVGDDHIKYLPVPTDRKHLPFTRRTKARHFLHIAGHPAYEDRNGTWDVLGCLRYVHSPIELTIKVQNKRFAHDIMTWLSEHRDADHVKVHVDSTDVEHYWDNYQPEYDVLLLPRKYGGLSLQRNEAMSAGMPVVMTDVSPQNMMLPTNLLVSVHQEKTIKTRTDIQVWQADHVGLAAKIDELYGNDELVAAMSDLMNQIADKESWEALKPKYLEEFTKLCQR